MPPFGKTLSGATSADELSVRLRRLIVDHVRSGRLSEPDALAGNSSVQQWLSNPESPDLDSAKRWMRRMFGKRTARRLLVQAERVITKHGPVVRSGDAPVASIFGRDRQGISDVRLHPAIPLVDAYGRIGRLRLEIAWSKQPLSLGHADILDGEDLDFVRFIDPTSGDVISVYAPTIRLETGDIPLPSSIADRGKKLVEAKKAQGLILLSQLLLDERDVRLMSNISVGTDEEPVRGFDPGVKYRGYALSMPPSGDWISMSDLLEDVSAVGSRISAAAIRRFRWMTSILQNVGVMIDPLESFSVDLDFGRMLFEPDGSMEIMDLNMLNESSRVEQMFDEPLWKSIADPSRNDYVPNISARSMGHDFLMLVASHMEGMARVNDETLDLRDESFGSLVDAMLEEWGPAVATEMLRDELGDNGMSPQICACVMSAWYDYVNGYVDRTLKQMAGERVSGITEDMLDSIMNSIRFDLERGFFPMLPLDGDNDMPLFTTREEARWIYERVIGGQRALRKLLGSRQGEGYVRATVERYLWSYGEDNIAHLPMILYILAHQSGGNPVVFSAHVRAAIDRIDPDREFTWCNYRDIEQLIGSYSPERPDGPKGGRMGERRLELVGERVNETPSDGSAPVAIGGRGPVMSGGSAFVVGGMAMFGPARAVK